jgi:hypothetical protein
MRALAVRLLAEPQATNAEDTITSTTPVITNGK